MLRFAPFILVLACKNSGVVLDDDPNVPIVRDPVSEVVMGDPTHVPIDGWASGVYPGDLDGDGHVDVVLWSGTEAWFYLGDGEGGLTRFTELSADALREDVLTGLDLDVELDAVRLNGIQVADMDGDRQADLVLSGNVQLEDEWRSFLGVLRAPMTFGVFEVVAEGVSGAPSVIGDLDGDGLPELIAFSAVSAVHTSRGLVWPLGEGLEWVYYPAAAAMHLDDGPSVDLVLFVNGGFGISEVRSWTQGADGLVPTDEASTLYAMSWAFGPHPHGVVDDVLLTDGQEVLRYDDGGLSVEVEDSGQWLGLHTMGDLDGDGRLDLLTWNGETAELLGSAAGDRLAPTPYTGPALDGVQPQVVDLNRDGLGDLVGVTYDAETGTTSLTVWLNVSDG